MFHPHVAEKRARKTKLNKASNVNRHFQLFQEVNKA